MLARSLGFVGLLLAVAGPVLGQAPDCTGISDVSDFDGAVVSDMQGQLTSVRVASGLSRPLLAISPPGNLQRLMIVEQDGTIRILRDGSLLAQAFLDVSSLTRSPADGGHDEEGLLGLAFHPDYDTNGWLFVYYTDVTGDNNVVERFTRSAADPDQADASTRTPVISIPHTVGANHNGGMIAFGPGDGYLYIATGDGGSFCGPNGYAQDMGNLLGKMLRLDVDSLPYSIPAGNPFDGGASADDDVIWSLGLRNPWRWSFDRITGALYIADVGQSRWEEINCRPASSTGGENYGWDHYEGDVCPNPSCGDEGTCTLDDLALPIQQYDHSEGCSISGGFVYRGCRMSDLHGHYFYADYCFDFIRSFRTDAACAAPAPLDRQADLAPGDGLDISSIVSFGEDARGEIYVIDRDGELFKILPELSIMELSGVNALPLLMGPAKSLAWEDLQDTSAHPLSGYKVYRAEGDPAGPFTCAHQGTVTSWSGDLLDPSAGETFYYVVTALNGAGDETRPGNRSDGTPRTVDTMSACGP